MSKSTLPKAFMNWSGGKGSALALFHVLQDGSLDVDTLFSTLNGELKRITMHGVHEELLEHQSSLMGMKVEKLYLTESVLMKEYDQLMHSKFTSFKTRGFERAIYGDIFLEDLKIYRDNNLKRANLKGVYPLWKRSSEELLEEFWDLGFKTTVVSINGSLLEKSFCGQELDRDFIKELPKGIDPCGENGEFHTFVTDGPYFKEPLKVKLNEVIEKSYTYKTAEGEEVKSLYYFADLSL
ncbi:Dph6-related ATP pyrophosphatase [Jiulongibacter sp. NS-SX5]|uniref:Dph6-related ATP pyrophosphatase n=1 Tax=Jiulongibacter sp. NS-SX5 TaxID=3463854 RepID=UPI004059164D